MKRKQKRMLGFLLACMMICLPVSQSLAAVSYDASAAVSNQVLFPGDSLINIAGELPILIDGEAVVPEVPGTWTNGSTDKVYTAATAEDGTSIGLSMAGYVLVVERGESKKNEEGADNSWNHYTFPEGEKPEIPQDVAFYSAGETVKLKAADSDEGMVFAGWKTDDETVTVADASNPETTLVMPEKKVTVTALYEEAQAETPAPEETSDPAMDPAADSEVVDPTADPAADPDIVDPTADPDTVDPSVDPSAADPSADPAIDPGTVDPTADPAADLSTADPSVDVTGGSAEGGDQDVDLTIENTDTVDVDNPIEVYNEETPIAYSVFVTDGSVSEETGAGPYTADTLVKVNANDYTADGLAFESWSVDSYNVEVDLYSAAIEFQMPQGDVYLTAHYKAIEPEQSESQESDPVQSESQESDPVQSESQEFEPVQSESQESEPVQSEPQESEPIQTEPQGAETQQSDAPSGESVVNTHEVVVENGSGSGTYAVGETVTLEAQAIEGQTFSGWKTDNEAVQLEDPAQAITTFVMPDASITVTAEYTAQVQEPADPQEPVNADEPGGDGGEQNDPKPVPYSLALSAGVSVTSIDNAPAAAGADGAYQVNEGAVVVVTATSGEGQTFKGWTVKDGNANPLTLMVDDQTQSDLTQQTLTFKMPASNVTLEAAYEKIPVQYTIKVANGTVTGATANADGSWTVTEGTQIVVTANPAPAGEAFSGWRITDSNNADVNPGVDTAASSITLTPAQNLNFQANYTGVQYSVSVTNGAANYTTAVSGTSVTITANAAPAGMEFDSWSVTSGNVSLANASSATTSFTMPAANVAITASYRQKTYSLTVKNGSSDADRYFMDDEPVITSNYPDTGKEFDYWYAESGNVVFDEDYLWKTSFTMPASDVTVAARYKDGPSTSDNKILDIVEGGEYYAGSTIKFTASGAGMDDEGLNPGDYRYRPTGYQISNVTGNWEAAPYTISMAIKAVGEYTLKVTFSKEVYDGEKWTADGTTDTKTVTFRVVNNTSVATGDNTPIIAVALIAGAALLVFLILLVVFIRRRGRK